MRKIWCVTVTLLLAGMAVVFAGEPKKADSKGEKPKDSPGWVIIEEDWSFPFLADFSILVLEARKHHRAKEIKATIAEIDKAIGWLKYAEGHAVKSTAEDISTARCDLMDCMAKLKSGVPVPAHKLDSAFAHASIALGNQHYFHSVKAIDEDDLITAGRFLVASADLLLAAAESANIKIEAKVVDICTDYAPGGYWDDTAVLEKSKLEANLATIKAELAIIAAKLKAIVPL